MRVPNCDTRSQESRKKGGVDSGTLIDYDGVLIECNFFLDCGLAKRSLLCSKPYFDTLLRFTRHFPEIQSKFDGCPRDV